MNLSKSRYTKGITCSKELWLSCYKPEEAEDTGKESILDKGTKVGELARSLFGDYKLVEFTTDFQKMLDDTKKYLEEKPNIICEASFSYDNNFCSVDILKNDIDGLSLYEVKSSGDIKDIYLDDITYQTWVLKKLGYNIKGSYLVYLNKEYIKEGDLDIHQLFKIKDVTDSLDLDIDSAVSSLKEVLNNQKEPNIDLSISCHEPYDCPFFSYCTKRLPKPNVFNLGWRLGFDKKLDIYNRGNITYQEILDKEILNDKVTNQLRIKDNEVIINKEHIKDFLSNIKYPLYFLDFESYQEPIPTIDGTHPNQQICFQYSLHYYLEEDGELYHKEYLESDYQANPMYGLCKKLVEDIPKDSCVIVYNQSFEKTRLQEMANTFPEFKDYLLNIKDHIVDLAEPFSKQDYYVKEMEGSYSIKKVLPALFPNNPELDYHNLDQVHKGDEASAAYLSLKDLNKEDEETLRKNMLKYCKLDTYATVKLLEKLKEVII